MAIRFEENTIFWWHLIHGGHSAFDSVMPEIVTMYLAPQ